MPLLIVLAVLAMQAALGLDFDPRYRDFPFAPLTGCVFPFLVIALLRHSWPAMRLTGKGPGEFVAVETEDARPLARRTPYPAEVAAATVLGLSAVYIVFNETPANWQAVWFCAGLIALAVTLLRVPDAPG